MQNQELLDGFLKIDGIRGSFLLNSDGNCNCQSFHSQTDLSALLKLTRDAIDINKTFGLSFQHGNFLQGNLEFEEEFLSIEPISNNIQVLVVVAKPGANAGRIRIEMKRVRKHLEESSK